MRPVRASTRKPRTLKRLLGFEQLEVRLALSGLSGLDLAPPVPDERPDTYIVVFDGTQEQESDATLASDEYKAVATVLQASEVRRILLSESHGKMLTEIERRLGTRVEVRYEYRVALDGMALKLTEEQAELVSEMSGVAVYENLASEVQTDAGPTWIGAPEIWNGTAITGLPDAKGEGILIGIVDTGIDPDHPSFAEVGPVDGYVHENPFGDGKFLGVCDPNHATFDPDFACNNKLVGAYNFVADTALGELFDHGSHVTSIAAGNVVEATVPGTNLATMISGVAPHANIIAYDTVSAADGFNYEADIVAAIDRAILDEVDVLNFSILPPFRDWLWDEPLAIALLRAYEDGIFIAHAAGNYGFDSVPGESHLPWLTSVGNVSHNRSFVSILEVTGPGEVPLELRGIVSIAGNGVRVTDEFGTPVVDAAAVAPGNHDGCSPFSEGLFTDKIALIDGGTCFSSEKIRNAAVAGAIGIVVINEVDGMSSAPSDPDNPQVRAVGISYEDGEALRDWIGDNSETTILLHRTTQVIDAAFGDVLNPSSSRGPNPFIDVIFPSVAAPGTNILAALAFSGPPSYIMFSGTSMASPHVAGAGALLKQVHPDWTAAEIQSALMTTSVPTTQIRSDDGETPATPFDVGSGRIDVTQAVRAGFVLDETYDNFVAQNPDVSGNPRTLNLAGFSTSTIDDTYSWTRTLRSTQDVDVVWTPSVTVAVGLGLSVSPMSVILPAGETAQITVTADTTGAKPDQWLFGEVVLTPDTDLPPAHFPVAVMNDSASPGVFFAELPDEPIRESFFNLRVFTVHLNTRPIDPVEITITPDDQLGVFPEVVSLSGKAPSRRIFVFAHSDRVVEGDHTGTLAFSITGTINDPNYPADFAIPPVTFNIADGDDAGFAILETDFNSQVGEGGTRDTLSVRLLDGPLTDVVLTVASNDPSEIAVEPSSLRFTPENWDVAQDVTIIGVPDLLDDGDTETTITVAVDADNSNALFHSVASQEVPVITKDEPASHISIRESGEAVVVRNESADVVVSTHGLGEPLNVVTGDIAETIDVGALAITNVALALNSGGGDDRIRLDDLNFERINGGRGFDVLALRTEQQHLDLTTLADERLQGIEGISITGSGPNQLSLDVTEVLNISTEQQTLIVAHDNDDVVFYGPGWDVNPPEFSNGAMFHVLTQGAARTGIQNRRPWQNPLDPLDADRDGRVAPLDVLLRVNTINRFGIRALPTPTSTEELPEYYYDADGDGSVSPIDILLVINHLNRNSFAGEGSEYVTLEGMIGATELTGANSRFANATTPVSRLPRAHVPREHEGVDNTVGLRQRESRAPEASLRVRPRPLANAVDYLANQDELMEFLHEIRKSSTFQCVI